MKNYTKTKIDRTWFSCLYDIQTWNGAGLFLQPGSPHGAGLPKDCWGKTLQNYIITMPVKLNCLQPWLAFNNGRSRWEERWLVTASNKWTTNATDVLQHLSFN